MSHFEVGKKVICVVGMTPNDMNVKKGDVFTLYGIHSGPCKHLPLLLDIGHSSDKRYADCGDCRIMILSQGVKWYDAKAFLPYDDLLSELTVEEILGEKHEKV